LRGWRGRRWWEVGGEVVVCVGGLRVSARLGDRRWRRWWGERLAE